MFIKSFTVGPVATNCYLVADETTKKGIIIDPGDQGERIAQFAKESGYDFEKILLTHGHWDHTSGLDGLVPNLNRNIPIYVHQLDYPGPDTGFGKSDLSAFKDQIRFYKDGETLEMGVETIIVLHTPGHTPGSVTLAIGDNLFTGDTLFCGSCGRTDFPGSSPKDMMVSLCCLAVIDGDYNVYPGHDRSTTLDFERKNNPFMRYAMEKFGRK